eukprot:gene3855-4806_t
MFGGDGDDFRLEVGSIPEGIKVLGVSHKHFKSDPLGLIPSSVQKLVVSDIEIGDLCRENGFVIPSTVKTLVIDEIVGSSDLNHDESAMLFPLPQSLTEVEFYTLSEDWESNHLKLDPGSLPNSIRVLKLGDYPFPLSEPGIIPGSVVELHIGNDFNHPIEKNCIPQGVRTLSIGSAFQKQLMPGSLPQSLTSFTLFNSKYEYLDQLFQPGILPSTLTYLRLQGGVIPDGITLPSSLEYLEAKITRIWKGLLPTGLKTLILIHLHPLQEIEIGSIPDTVTYLDMFSSTIRIPIVKGMLPSSISNLIFRGINMVESSPYLPDSITTLQLYGSLNRIPKGAIPLKVNKLIISNTVGFEDGAIPNSVEHIVFKTQPSFPLTESIIPLGLVNLEIVVDIQDFEPKYLDFPICTIQELSIKHAIPSELPELSISKEFIDFLAKLFQDCTSQLRIHLLDGFTLLSIDKNDQYIYYVDHNAFIEGFIKKSDISSNLNKIITEFIQIYY